MMNLDEAIQHCKEKAKEQRSKAIGYFNGGYSSQIEGKSCLNCAEEHEQLAEWLTELKNMKDCIKTECFKCAKEHEQENKGEWIAREDMDYLDENKVVHKHFECNKCGLVHDFIDGHTSQYIFCPHCGSEMRKGGTE